MKQNEKNIQKDQELTKEELEQVNGGRICNSTNSERVLNR